MSKLKFRKHFSFNLTKRTNNDNVTGSVSFSFILINKSNLENSISIQNLNNKITTNCIGLQNNMINCIENSSDITETEQNKKLNCSKLEDFSKQALSSNSDRYSNLKIIETSCSVNNMSSDPSSSSSYIINNCNHRSLPNFQVKNNDYENKNNSGKIENNISFTSSGVNSSSSNSTSSDETTTNEETYMNNFTEENSNNEFPPSSIGNKQKGDPASTIFNISSNLCFSSSADSISLSKLQPNDLNNSIQPILTSQIKNSSEINDIKLKYNREKLNINLISNPNFKKSKGKIPKLKKKCNSLEFLSSKIKSIDSTRPKSETNIFDSSCNLYFVFLRLKQLNFQPKNVLKRSISLNSYLSEKGNHNIVIKNLILLQISFFLFVFIITKFLKFWLL